MARLRSRSGKVCFFFGGGGWVRGGVGGEGGEGRARDMRGELFFLSEKKSLSSSSFVFYHRSPEPAPELRDRACVVLEPH